MENQLTGRTFDLESTDFPPEADIIEAGYVDSVVEREHAEAPWLVVTTVKRKAKKFFKPDRECTIEARSTHHIHPWEYADADHHTTMPQWLLNADGVTPQLLIAHNAEFEKTFVTAPDGCYYVDTYKIALRVYPDFKRHNNQFLKYALKLDLSDDDTMPPHRALPDSFVTAHIFATMLNSGTCTLKEMIQWTREPPYLTKIGFGKHFGKKFSEVPKDYLRWCLGQDMDEGVLAACRRELGIS